MIGAHHDTAAEQATIGSVLYNERHFEALTADGLTADDFFTPANRTLWRIIADMQKAGDPVDAITIQAHMSTDTIEAIGGVMYLEQCIALAVIPSNAKGYAKVVMDMARLRAIDKAMMDAQCAMQDDGADPGLIASQLEMDVQRASAGRSKKRQRTVLEAYDAQVELWDKAVETGGIGLHTGIRVLDEGFGGFVPGLVTLVSGPPGACKTTTVRQAVQYITLATGTPVAFKSLEQTTEQLSGSIAASLSGATVWKLNTGCRGDVQAHANEMHRIRSAREQIERITSLLTIDDSRSTMPEVWAWARRAITAGARCLVLDHLGKIVSTKADEGMRHDLIIADRITQMADIAKEHNIPFVVIVPENKQGGMANAAAIEYEGGNWLRMDYEDPEDRHKGEYVATIRKSRFGKILPPTVMCWHNDMLLPREEVNAMQANEEFTA